jgi:hypothetical protein
MRDISDAKAMAHTLRSALAARDIKITISQSLELIAEAFGAADWNTLAAAIRADAPAARKAAKPAPPIEDTATPGLSTELQSTLQRALDYANQRQHEYTTLEHLLLALIDDAEASALMKTSKVDLVALKQDLAGYIDTELKRLVIDDGSASRPTAAVQRALRGAELYALGLRRPEVTGAQLLAGIFPETRSPAVRFLGERGMSREETVNLIE